MFTGLIEELGNLSNLEIAENGARIQISAKMVTFGMAEGDSIAVNGVCLTALEITPQLFLADVSQETLDRTTLGGLKSGSPVNLERSVKPSTRLGGHIVQGHVDGVGAFLHSIPEGDCWTTRIAYPKEIARYIVFKGSIAIEGISLTIANLNDDYFEVAIIPATWNNTNLSTLKEGDEVNLEVDIIGKYVERMMKFGVK